MPVAEIDPVTVLDRSTSACEPEPESGPFPWLLAMLQQVMAAVVAAEAAPLQQASVITRLGHLYLKAFRASELQKENRALTRRVAELEKCLTAAERPGASTQDHPAQPSRQTACGPDQESPRGKVAPAARPRDEQPRPGKQPADHSGAPLLADAAPVVTVSHAHASGRGSPRGGTTPPLRNRRRPRR
jgi:hypothetical protein